jgi:hypothetical protein
LEGKGRRRRRRRRRPTAATPEVRKLLVAASNFNSALRNSKEATAAKRKST